jgi:hypothetical protein
LRLARHKDAVCGREYTDLKCISHDFVEEKAKSKDYPGLNLPSDDNEMSNAQWTKLFSGALRPQKSIYYQFPRIHFLTEKYEGILPDTKLTGFSTRHLEDTRNRVYLQKLAFSSPHSPPIRRATASRARISLSKYTRCALWKLTERTKQPRHALWEHTEQPRSNNHEGKLY